MLHGPGVDVWAAQDNLTAGDLSWKSPTPLQGIQTEPKKGHGRGSQSPTPKQCQMGFDVGLQKATSPDIP